MLSLENINPHKIKQKVLLSTLKNPFGGFFLALSLCSLGGSFFMQSGLTKLFTQLFSIVGISLGLTIYSFLFRPKRLQNKFLEIYNEMINTRKVKEEEYFSDLQKSFLNLGYNNIAKEIRELIFSYNRFEEFIKNASTGVTYRIESEGKQIFDNASQVFERLLLIIKTAKCEDPSVLENEIAEYQKEILKLKKDKTKNSDKEIKLAEDALALRKSRLGQHKNIDSKIEKALLFTETAETWLKNAVEGNLDLGIDKKSKELTKAIDEFKLTLEAAQDVHDESLNIRKNIDLL